MKRGRFLANGVVALISVMALAAGATRLLAQDDQSAAYPKPSPYPISWELTFNHSVPRRIVVTLPGDRTPSVFWYMTYSVINQSNTAANFDPDRDKERIFYPTFVMRLDSGKIIPANDGVHPVLYAAIKAQERIKFLEEPTLSGGKILLGPDQERDSVAIWPETSQRMGGFTIFASGMWGETAAAKDTDGNVLKNSKGEPITLQKTLMMTYHVDGDETHFDAVRKVSEEFVMR
jgi:hypothetical protein